MKWTESKAKEDLYNKYRGKWLANHDFNFVDIIKKYREYSKECNIDLITKEKFEDFEYNNTFPEDEMWLDYYNWESEVLCKELADIITEAIGDDCECLFNKDYRYAYFSSPYADMKIKLEDNTENTSISEVAYDIAMALISFEYEDEDEFKKVKKQLFDKMPNNLSMKWLKKHGFEQM